MLDSALKILNKLNDCGYESYIVGGFVRDYLLGLESNDIDINTSARPKEVLEIFEDAELSSRDYGTVVVTRNGYRFEITTFRKDISYKDHRHPDEIVYINDLNEDILRRDFTINTICMDKDKNIIDLLSAKKDIKNKVIKTVGDPNIRFEEDALRILRAIRFSTSLDFKLSDDVVDAIKKNKHLLTKISYKRKKDELDKIFTSSNIESGIKMLLEYGLDKDLELSNLDKIVPSSGLIGIWSVLNVVDKYPFTNNEKDLIKKVNELLELNEYDNMTLYTYGLYVCSVACDIKGLDKKKITEAYNSLEIHSRSDLDITSEEIMDILNMESGKYLSDIYKDLVKEVVYNNIENKNDVLKYYIISNYK